jgi:hypothetical protein
LVFTVLTGAFLPAGLFTRAAVGFAFFELRLGADFRGLGLDADFLGFRLAAGFFVRVGIRW